MQIYSLYSMARDNSGIEGLEELEAPNDEAAIGFVAKLPRSGDIELWHGKRRVRKFAKVSQAALISGRRFPFNPMTREGASGS